MAVGSGQSKRVGKDSSECSVLREERIVGNCVVLTVFLFGGLLLTAYCRLFFGWVRLEAGQEVAGFWGLGLEVGFYVVDVDCGGWVGG